MTKIIIFMRQIPLLCFALYCHLGSGQVHTINGIIKDAATREPLPYATIRLLNSSKTMTADSLGWFRIGIPKASKIPYLLISHLGYNADTELVMANINQYVFFLNSFQGSIGEIVVTGVSKATMVRENPVPVIIIPPKAIDQSVESNIIDALAQNAPGLNAVKTGPNVSKPFIHGLGYNRVLTLFDGVRQEGQQWGDEHGIILDDYNIERAEVIKGPSSIMYGSDALAGVLSLIPVQPYLQKAGFLEDTLPNINPIMDSLAMLSV